MNQNSQLKNYYDILNISFDASTFDIENAYQKLATQWHPDKHKTDRILAQKKFHDISQAYEILSDKNKRSHYNDMLQMQYSIEDANSTFQKFFGQHGIVDEEEEQFFTTNYPEQTKNYYRILGVPRDATIEDIKKAYRKLSIKYHPKNNPNNVEAHKKFIDLNEAFNALSNEWKRKTYDTVLFNQIEPVRAHDIFEDFFGSRLYELPQEEQFFKPILTKKWTRQLDNMMDQQKNFGNIDNGQAVKTSTVYNNNNGVQTKKTVTTKKVVKDGKATQQTTEQYTFPTGAKQVTKTIKDGDKVTIKRYDIKKGEQVPKELTQ